MSNLIDPILSGNSKADILRCLQIGLLCVQQDIVERPPMSAVVTMLSSYSISIPTPSQPAAIVGSDMNIAESSETSSSWVQSSREVTSEESRTKYVEGFPVEAPKIAADLYPR